MQLPASASAPSTHLIAAFGVLVLAAVGFGALARRVGQPAVVGEILGGVMLGPAVLGHLPGDPSTLLFPHPVQDRLGALAQLGLVFYMFTIGHELDLNIVRRHPRTVGAVSIGAVALPLLGGLMLGLALAEGHRHRPAFVLFIGVLVTITAVPVLARLLTDRGLAGTTIGTTALAVATVTDALAWILLAIAIALAGDTGFGGPAVIAVSALGGVVLLAAAGRYGMRAVFRRMAPGTPAATSLVVAMLMGCAYLSSVAGLHSALGALLCGVLMPRQPGGQPDHAVAAPIEHLSRCLLPVFFAGAGLAIEVSWTDSRMWTLVATITVVAASTKLVGAWLGARLAGMECRPAAAVAALLNSRGLTELVAIEIGRQAGLLDMTLYGVFVIVALLTTVMTGPLLSRTGTHCPAPPPKYRLGHRRSVTLTNLLSPGRLRTK